MSARTSTLGLLIAAAALAPLPAHAMCKEKRATTSHDEFKLSKLVVMGTVSATRTAPTGDNTTLVSTDYTIAVSKWLKGRKVSPLVLHFDSIGTRFTMDETRTYLLFVLQRPDGSYFVDNCGNSAKFAVKDKSAPQAKRPR